MVASPNLNWWIPDFWSINSIWYQSPCQYSSSYNFWIGLLTVYQADPLCQERLGIYTGSFSAVFLKLFRKGCVFSRKTRAGKAWQFVFFFRMLCILLFSNGGVFLGWVRDGLGGGVVQFFCFWLEGVGIHMNIYWYIQTWNPNDLYFWRLTTQNKAFSNQNKGLLGSRNIYIN